MFEMSWELMFMGTMMELTSGLLPMCCDFTLRRVLFGGPKIALQKGLLG